MNASQEGNTKLTLLGRIFLALHTHVPGAYQGLRDLVSVFFTSYFNDSGADPAWVTRMKLYGVPRRLITFYADPEHTGCPRKLSDDIAHAVEYAFSDGVQRARAYHALIEIIRDLPAVDQENLLPGTVQPYPSERELHDLLSGLIWYGAGYDFLLCHQAA